MEAKFFIGKNVEAVVGAIHLQGTREFAWARAEIFQRACLAALLHFIDSNIWFQGADEDKAILRAPFDQEVQQPVDTVIQIHISGASGASRHKFTRRGTTERVAGFIVEDRVGFGFHNDTAASVPEQLASDHFAGTRNRIALKKFSSQQCSHVAVARVL